MKHEPGTRCTVNDSGDLYMMREARPFIWADCVIVKVTKGGLVQVALVVDQRKTYSVPGRNISVSA